MAFLSTASLRAAVMAVLSASVQVPIVKGGVLHLVMISTEAGLLEMVVVQVVMVVVMVEHACCCLLPRRRAASSSLSSALLAVLVELAAPGPTVGDRPVSSLILSMSLPNAAKFAVSCFKVLRSFSVE